MEITGYGYAIVMLSFALMVALAYLGAILKQNSELKGRLARHQSDARGYMNALSARQVRINAAEGTAKKLQEQIDLITEELRIAREETAYVNETLREQEELIRERDVELGYNEQYMASQQHVLELSQKEIDDLHRKLKAAESPYYLKACLLEKIQECGNLRHLNELLENANASYAADLKLIKSEFQAMMARINATEFDQIRFPFTYPASGMDDMNKEPDLGPETCTSQEPQDPADSMESQQVSACF
jgi:chromosome segregation ATPase